MAVSTTRNYFSSMVITINGQDSKARLTKCDYLFETPKNAPGALSGTISLELILDYKAKELAYWSPENTRKFSGTIVCKNSAGDVVRTITFFEALSKTFMETIDVNNPTTIVTRVQLEAGRITLT